MKQRITILLLVAAFLLMLCACGHKREEQEGSEYTILTSEEVEKNSEEEFEQEAEKVRDKKETKKLKEATGVQKNNGTIQTENGLDPWELPEDTDNNE